MKKILVVDEDKSIRLVLSTALTRSGFLVKPVLQLLVFLLKPINLML